MTQTETNDNPVKQKKLKSYTVKNGTKQEIKGICNQLSYINYNNQAVLDAQVEQCKTKLQEIKEGN